MKELGEKNRSVSRTGPTLGGWGELKQGSDPHIRATVLVRGGTFKAKSETADWKENGKRIR